jgi:ABC-type Mn2+/Zn2+ transport system ATPase subunit
VTRTDTVAEIDGLRMHYGSTTVLAEVTFVIRRGEVLALLGPNGAGKTTTIEVLEGFRIRSGCRVSVLGSDPEHGDQRWRARIGVVLQSWRDHGKWRVRELLAQLGSYYAAYADGDRPRPWDTDELIAAVGLTDRAATRVERLSGGQRRRLDVAVGLVGRPELLFLDEPTAGFDPQARREFHDLLLAADRLSAWATLAWVVPLGFVATQSIGATLGALVSGPRATGYLSALVMGSISISGIFYPITALPHRLQWVAEAFPVYWLGLGMRSALLPAGAVATELGHSWHRPETAVVLGEAGPIRRPSTASARQRLCGNGSRPPPGRYVTESRDEKTTTLDR